MVTKVTKYIGPQASAPAGVTSDFAIANAFDNWVSTQDLVAQDIWIDAQVFANQSDVDMANCYMNPVTFDDTHYVVLRPYDGMSVRELENNATGPLDYGTQGIELTMKMQRLQVGNGVWVQDFRINVTDDGSYGSNTDLYAIWVGPQTNNGQTQPATSVGGLRRCRIKSNVINAGNGAVRNSNAGGANTITDCVFFQSSGAGCFVRNTNSVGLTGRNTFVRTGTSTGPAVVNGTSSGPMIRNNAFVNCSDTPITIGQGTYANISSNYSNVATSQTGVTYGAQLINSNTDLRPSAGSPLIGGANASAASTLDVRLNNRGATPDAGAVQLTPAAALPTGTITSVTVNGTSVTVSGTTTNAPTAVKVGLTPTTKAYNSGVAVPQANATLGAGTFTITFNNVAVGEYAVAGVASNTGGSSNLVNNQPNANVVGAQGVITSQTIAGQTLTVSGTTTGNPTSASIIVPAAATPNGAVSAGPQVVALGAGTFTADVPLVPGDYDKPVVTFTTAAGTSLPATGGSTIQVLAISGNPEAPMPANPVDPSTPTVTVPQEPQNVAATAGILSATVSFTAPISDGGSAITGYTVKASTGQTKSGVASPITLTMPGNVSASFTVHATNSIGDGPESLASNVVTPTSTDTTPPSLLGTLSISGVTTTGFTVTTPAATDNVGVAGYEYSIDSGATYTQNGMNTSKTYVGLADSTQFTVLVRAFDAAGLRSNALTTTVTTDTPVVVPPTRTVTLVLADENGVLANLSGIRVAVFDEPLPDLRNAPKYTSAIAATNAQGTLTITFPSALPVGGLCGVSVQTVDGRNFDVSSTVS